MSAEENIRQFPDINLLKDAIPVIEEMRFWLSDNNRIAVNEAIKLIRLELGKFQTGGGKHTLGGETHG